MRCAAQPQASGRTTAAPCSWPRPRGRLFVATRAAAAYQSTAASLPAAAAAAAAPLLALKEWAPTCAAIASGEQTILLRKGGIKEPTFTPAARQFLLFPTSFHTDAELLKPAAAQRYSAEVAFDPKAQARLAFGTRCTITGAWTTHDPAVLQLLDELHVWGLGFLETRLRWRAKQPITVLELRAERLAAPLVVPLEEEFFGCFSWVDLSSSAAGQLAAGQLAEAELTLDDAAFAARQAAARRQLGQLADLQELAGF